MQIVDNEHITLQEEKQMKLYKYGMRLRGFSIGCQPMKNFWERQDDNGNYDRHYHDILLYTEKLADEDLRNYELDYLGEIEQ